MKNQKTKKKTFDRYYEWEECTPSSWIKAGWMGRLTCRFLGQHVKRLGINSKKNSNYIECERCNRRWHLKRNTPLIKSF